MLDSIDPTEAVQMYLDDRKPEVTQTPFTNTSVGSIGFWSGAAMMVWTT